MNYKNMGSSDPTPLARLQSVYSLTLDEFQNTISGMGLAKDFGSMNMDEFLKNIWTAEENQAMASTSASAATAAAAAAGGGGLQRQGSLTLPRTISQKTVDEVWRDFGGQREFQQQQPSDRAYTMELEAEIAKLKEQNEDLQKKQVDIMEMQKNQVLEVITQQHVPKKRCLRRTQTGPW